MGQISHIGHIDQMGQMGHIGQWSNGLMNYKKNHLTRWLSEFSAAKIVK